ncbi:tetratricopeptide (TPR) repeat protein [Duganella sp. 1224]|uniref:tetratricopeptide repeat protein n=1 Tax=Duganella sp. 1224 TaxID=2587052 RepID=UPI0015CDCBE2|nr:tetratricopeptide repeat protein [Duganella sp. 1224]NYE59681.1 tetratricopeptide (TPR) repeat protein [Duganella sp. 1224]
MTVGIDSVSLDPALQASAVFAEFQQRAQGLPADDDYPWQQALRHSLNDERLADADARELFEYRIATLLADGWQPGHEALLVAAMSVFGWREHRQRLQLLGDAGALLDVACGERAAYDQQPARERERQRQLIARLRDGTPPATGQLAYAAPLLEQLLARYPTWLGMVTSVPHILQWRAQYARVPAWRKLPARIGKTGLLIGGVLIALTIVVGLLPGGGDTRRAPPLTAANLTERGTDALDQRKLPEAIHYYTQAIRLAPKDATLYSMRAIAHAWSGDFDPAQHDLDRSAELDGANALLFRARGILAYERKQYSDAADAYTRSLQLEPDHLFTLLQRAHTWLALHDYPQALADADQMLKLNPTYGTAPYWVRLRVARAQNNHADAMRQIQAMLTALPENSYAYHTAARAYMLWQQPADALAVLNRGIERKPDADLYFLRAQLRPQAQLAQKRDDLARALSLAPTSFQLARTAAELEINSRNFSKAVPILTQVLQRGGVNDSQRATLLGLRGIAYTGAGNGKQAHSDYQAARALVDNAIGLNNLCWLLATHNTSLDEALALCDASLYRLPDYAAALDSRGMVLLRLGRYQDAIAAYDAALARRPDFAGSLYGRGLARRKLGQHSAADADLKAARALDEDVDEDFRTMGLVPAQA